MTTSEQARLLACILALRSARPFVLKYLHLMQLICADGPEVNAAKQALHQIDEALK